MNNLPLLVLDFETYYDQNFSLKRLSIPEYVYDFRFRIHGLAVRHPDGRKGFSWDVDLMLDSLKRDYGVSLEKAIVVTHNAAFDLYILAKLFDNHPMRFLDTMLLAHHLHGRKGKGHGESATLKALSIKYELRPKGELEFMSGVINPDVTQRVKLEDYALNDVENTYRLALLMLPEISRPEVELPLMMHTIRLFTERAAKVDLDGLRALRNDIKADCEKWFLEAGVSPDQVSGSKVFPELLKKALARSGRKLALKQGKSGLIPALAKTDSAMQALIDDDDPVVEALVKARLGKKSSEQLLARLDKMEGVTRATGGGLPVYLVYYGAHTGRFAGGGKLNMQNMGKSGYGLRIRKLLVPRPGMVYIIGDLGQIEARVLAWLAGQDDLLAAFAEKRDIYSEFACSIFGRAVRKPIEGDSTELIAQLTADRNVGKSAVLGLGFQMGGLRFMNECRSKPDLAHLFDSGILNPLKCREIVEKYRKQFPRITSFWQNIENAFRLVIHGGSRAVGHLRLENASGVIRIILPSGRALRYPNPRFAYEPRTISYLDKNGEESEFTPGAAQIVYGSDTVTYGGKVTENIVQAVARDLLVEAMLRLEVCGYEILFHVHDEVVLECSAAKSKEVKAAVYAELVSAPPWARGLPLDAEVKIKECYGK